VTIEVFNLPMTFRVTAMWLTY